MSPAPRPQANIQQYSRFSAGETADKDADWRPSKQREAILSLGASVETKLELAEGETVVASVQSDAFDPALAVVAPDGKQVSVNEDRDEGDQSPLLVYRAATAGTHRLRVFSNQAGSGGKFELRYRSFRSFPAQLGKHALSLPQPEGREPDRLTLRLELTKGKAYDIRAVEQTQVGPRGTRIKSQEGAMRIVGPTGIPSRDYEVLAETMHLGGVVVARRTGTYYLEYGAGAAPVCETNFAEVQTERLGLDETRQLSLGDWEARVLEFDVKAGQSLGTTISGTAGRPVFTVTRPVEGKEETDLEGDAGDGYGTGSGHVFFLTNSYAGGETLRVFRLGGRVRVVVRGRQGTEKVQVKNSTRLEAWTADKPIERSLGIADARVFSFDAEQSELVRVAASAIGFEPKLEIFTLNGELVNTLMDRATHRAGDDLYFPSKGTFLVRLTCEGNGGSGDFRMLRTTLAAKPYTLGSVVTTKLDSETYGLYSVTLEAGKRYELLTDQTEGLSLADLVDAEGNFLLSHNLVFGKTQVAYFTARLSGAHRMWLRGHAKAQRLVLRAHADPVVGG